MMYRPAWKNPRRGDFVMRHRFARTTKETIATALTLAAVAIAILGLTTTSANAAIFLTESFEDPDLTGLTSNLWVYVSALIKTTYIISSPKTPHFQEG